MISRLPAQVRPLGDFFLPGPDLRSVLLQILEELTFRLDHQHIPLVAEYRTVSLEAAVEVVELGILLVGRRIDGSRFGIAFTAQFLGALVGVGQNDGALTIGIRTDTFGKLVTTGTMTPGFPLPL